MTTTEIAAALAEYLGKELVIMDMDFEAVCLAVGQGKCDIAMAGLTVNETRKEHVAFTDAYYQASQVLVVKADDTIFDACTTAAEVEAILNGFDSKTGFGVQTGFSGRWHKPQKRNCPGRGEGSCYARCTRKTGIVLTTCCSRDIRYRNG